MKVMVTTLGCEKDYGERQVVVEDDQIGALTIREMELDSLDELFALAEDVDHIEIESTVWDKYAADVTMLCGDL